MTRWRTTKEKGPTPRKWHENVGRTVKGGGGGEVRKKEKKASETRKNRLFGI